MCVFARVYVSEYHSQTTDKQTDAPNTFIKVRKYAIFQGKIRDAVN